MCLVRAFYRLQRSRQKVQGGSIKAKKVKVLVLMGGKTPEHEISLISGREVVRNLPESRYTALPIIISRDGTRWQLENKGTFLADKPLLPAKREVVEPKQISGRADVVFIAMHGPCGEDGTIQGMLEIFGIPYTGSGVLASALGNNKAVFRRLIKKHGFPMPKYIEVKKGEDLINIEKRLGKPFYFVQPHNQGSAIGASIAKKKSDLKASLKLAFQYSNLALIDKFIKGIEVTCGILGNENPKALPLVEIIPKNEFFDYEAKYSPETQEICPARISQKLTREIQKISLEVYKMLGCRGFARLDFIIEDGERPILLEINTIPGLTQASLLPKEARAAGLSYPKLLDKIIQYALE